MHFDYHQNIMQESAFEECLDLGGYRQSRGM